MKAPRRDLLGELNLRDMEDENFDALTEPTLDIRHNALHSTSSNLQRRQSLPFGGRSRSLIHLDTGNFERDQSPAAGRAIDRLRANLQQRFTDVLIETGSYIFIDSLSTHHGRGVYAPRLGPHGRKLTRSTSASGVRKSANLRQESQRGQVIAA